MLFRTCDLAIDDNLDDILACKDRKKTRKKTRDQNKDGKAIHSMTKYKHLAEGHSP